jgi:hypothetical protein
MSEWSSRLAAVSVFGRTWANSRSGLWRKAAVDGSLRSVLHFCAPRFGPLHPVEMENPYGQALKDQSRSNAVHRAAQHRRQSCPVDRAATSLSEELVAGPLVPLPFGGAVMHRFHPHAHRSSCCCERAICRGALPAQISTGRSGGRSPIAPRRSPANGGSLPLEAHRRTRALSKFPSRRARTTGTRSNQSP